jgi:hypothetical protein
MDQHVCAVLQVAVALSIGSVEIRYVYEDVAAPDRSILPFVAGICPAVPRVKLT